jgi:phosphatidate cytidylyltransferase
VSAVAIKPAPALSSALATRVATGIALVAAVLAALFLLPPAGWAVVVLLIVAVGADEWARLIEFAGSRRILFVGVTLVAGIALLVASSSDQWPPAIVIAVCGLATLFWIVVGTPSVLLRWQPVSSLARAVSGWIVLLGAFVAIASLQARSPWLVLAAMAIVWVADTAAYFVGRRFGRRKLAPQISPGKTWEGAYGAGAAVVVYALVVALLAARAGFEAPFGAVTLMLWIVFAVAVAALSIVGDLHESLLKRRAGVKDSGALLPGHGGILDRTDALLAAMPPVALAALTLFTRV